MSSPTSSMVERQTYCVLPRVRKLACMSSARLSRQNISFSFRCTQCSRPHITFLGARDHQTLTLPLQALECAASLTSCFCLFWWQDITQTLTLSLQVWLAGRKTTTYSLTYLLSTSVGICSWPHITFLPILMARHHTNIKSLSLSLSLSTSRNSLSEIKIFRLCGVL